MTENVYRRLESITEKKNNKKAKNNPLKKTPKDVIEKNKILKSQVAIHFSSLNK